MSTASTTTPTAELDRYLPPVLQRDDLFADLVNEAESGIFYINAYEMHQGYGGPEEGGWWYDILVPLASVPVSSRQEGIEHYRRLEAIYQARYADGDRTATHGRPELSIAVETDTAKASPETRPHYE